MNVRIQSACYTAEIFRSTDCDCHAQLETSLSKIGSDGGLLVYMLCDGRGAGLLTKRFVVWSWDEQGDLIHLMPTVNWGPIMILELRTHWRDSQTFRSNKSQIADEQPT